MKYYCPLYRGVLKRNLLSFSVCQSVNLPLCVCLAGLMSRLLSSLLKLDCCLAGFLSICLTGWLAGLLSVSLSVWLAVCQYVCLVVCLTGCLTGWLFLYMRILFLFTLPWFTWWLTHNKILKIFPMVHCRLLCVTPLKSIVKTLSGTFSCDGYTLELYI